jgi:hypothetical protein
LGFTKECPEHVGYFRESTDCTPELIYCESSFACEDLSTGRAVTRDADGVWRYDDDGSRVADGFPILVYGFPDQGVTGDENNGGSAPDSTGAGNSCSFANDGNCNDGPDGDCEIGTDCTDCGNCDIPTPVGTKNNYCEYANDQGCDDNNGFCDPGTDCVDCDNCGEPIDDPQQTDPLDPPDAGTDPDPVVTPGECESELPAYCGPEDCDVSECLMQEVVRGTHCGDPNAADVVNTNICDFAIRVEICFEKTDGTADGCGRSTIEPGQGNNGFWACGAITGRYWAIVLPDDRSGVDCHIACLTGYNCN